MKLEWKNKNQSKIRDWHNWTRSALFGGIGGGGNFENWVICNLRKGDQINEIWYLEGSCALKF